MLLSEIIFNIKNLPDGGLQSDDNRLADEQLIFIFDYYKARWAHQEYNKRGYGALTTLEQNLFQVKVTDLDETNSVGAGHAMKNVSVTEAIPRLVMLTSSPALSYIRSVDGTQSYNKIGRNRMALMEHARYTSDEGYYYPYGDRFVIRFPGKEPADLIAITGIFESPQVVMQYVLDQENAIELKKDKDFEDVVLDPDFNYEYPVSSVAMDGIVKMMIDSEIKISEIFPSEDVKDTTDKKVFNA